MRKKFLSKILTASVALGFLASSQVNATGVLGGIEYWTVDDLIEFDREVASEREARCGTDAACWEDFYVYNMDISEERMRYQNLENFNIESVVISSINPSTGEIRFVYHGQDTWDKNHNPNSSPSPLGELYMVWLDEGVPDPGEDYSWFNPAAGHFYPYYVDELISGNIEYYTHPVFQYDLALTGETLPWDTEITAWSETDLRDNSRNTLYYTSIIGGRIKSSIIDYSSCLNHPYYRDGMECKFIYDLPNVPRFVPFTKKGEMASEETISHLEDNTASGENDEVNNNPENEDNTDIVSNENDTDDNSNTNNDADGNGENGDSDSSADDHSDDSTHGDSSSSTNGNSEKENSTEVNSDFPSAAEQQADAIKKLDDIANSGNLAIGKGATIPSKSNLVPLAPDTGAYSNECTKTINFPWWFLGLLGVGDVFIMWLFLPTRKRK